MIANLMGLMNSDNSILERSIFENVLSKKTDGRTHMRDSNTNGSLKSKEDLFARIEKLNVQKQEILNIAQKKDFKAIKELQMVLDDNGYLYDLDKFKHDLKTKSPGDFAFHNYIRKNTLVKKIQKGESLQTFVESFGDIKLDVVSISEARSLFDNVDS